MSGLFSPTPSTPNAQQTVAAAGLQVQTSAYGLPVPILFGKNQTTPNLIQMVGFAAHQKVEPSASGGKGGSPSPTSITYTYTVTPLFGLCEGTITSFDTIRKDKESPTSLTGWATFTGSQTSAWAYMTSSFSGEARVYPKIAYIAYQNYDLGTSTGLPNHSVVITGLNPYSTGNSYYDAHPVTIVKELLTSSQFGIGFTRLDPSVDTAGSTTFWNYCVAIKSASNNQRMLFSPLLKEQRPTAEIINEIIMAANGAFVWSEGYLKIKPYGDTNISGTSPFAGVSFTANTTPVYSLTDNDFMSKKNEDPIKVIRKPRNDTYNQISIEYVDKDKQYNPSIVEVKDDADIEQFGLRKKDTVKMHFITNKDTAQMVAQLILQKNLSIVNKYQFVLGWRYCLLEPMDLVNITDSNLGFNAKTVRITSISENDQGLLTIEAEDFPLGASSPALYTTGSGQGTGTNYGADPGNVNTPYFINPPYFLTPSGQELWMAVSADSPFWGGCTVYASLDNVDYAPIGTIFNKARYGVSTGSITNNSGNINDTTNTLAVDLDISNGELLSTDAAGLAAYVTLSAIQTSATSGLELISYQTASLTSGYAYNISTMKRGVYGTTIQSHASNSQFIRLDDAIFKWLVPSTFIGQLTYFKFVSTNVFGTFTKDITTATAYSTTIPTQNLPQPTNVVLTITETKG
jgi:hypothetical protein